MSTNDLDSKIVDISKLSLAPSDTLIIRVSNNVPREQLERIASLFEKLLPKDAKVAVASEDVTFEIIRPPQVAESH